MELEEAATPENVEDIPFEFDVRFVNEHGEQFGNVKSTLVNLPPAPEGATRIDGYVKTPFGTFGIETWDRDARRLLTNIREYCNAKKEVETFTAKRNEELTHRALPEWETRQGLQSATFRLERAKSVEQCKID